MADYIEDPIINWVLMSICLPNLIKNPYLVAKIIEVLFVINLSVPLKLKNVYEKFMDHPMSQTYLPSAMMRFYTDIETTGQSTEFYDKFTIRFHISIILKGMWDRPIHKQVNEVFRFDFSIRNIYVVEPKKFDIVSKRSLIEALSNSRWFERSSDTSSI